MVKIAPSILSADLYDLRSDIERVLARDIDMLHVDVMDGHFVPNITFGIPLVKSLRKHLDIELDVHLMISDPGKYASLFVEAGADIVTVHVEASADPKGLLRSVRDEGAMCGITLNPSTPLKSLEPVLDQVDMVLIMSVNPGFGGQRFIPESIPRLIELRSLLESAGSGIPVEIDGGITPVTAPDVVGAGADIIVAGSAVFSANGGDIEGNIDALRAGIRLGMSRGN